MDRASGHIWPYVLAVVMLLLYGSITPRYMACTPPTCPGRPGRGAALSGAGAPESSPQAHCVGERFELAADVAGGLVHELGDTLRRQVLDPVTDVVGRAGEGGVLDQRVEPRRSRRRCPRR